MRVTAWCCAFIVGMAVTGCTSAQPPFRLPTPLGLDEFFPVPEENPLTQEKIELGERLFFDPLLSADRSISCASCHLPERAFSDSVALSRGAHGRTGTRNAPSLLNRAYARSLFWDGRVETLEEQVLHPVHDPLEMDLPLEEMLSRLRRHPRYPAAYRRAFREGVTAENTAHALASYLRTLRSGDSPVDRYRAGDQTALSAEAQRGFTLFLGKANCTACHVGPNFTDETFHNTGIAQGSGDVGRFAITGVESDRGAFKTPSLREVERTAPYMHDGSLATLEEVIEFYDRGGTPNPHLDPEIRPLRLTEEEKRSLQAFLRALSTERPDSHRDAATGRKCKPRLAVPEVSATNGDEATRTLNPLEKP